MRFIQLIALLSFSLFFSCLPLQAQHPPVVGVVAISNDAYSATVPLSVGSTIYSGEPVSTAKTGRLQVRAGALLLSLAPSSSARVFGSGESVVVQLESGSLVYSAKMLAGPLAIFADDIKFAPVPAQRATGQIELLSLCAVSAHVSQGALEVTSAGGVHTVREGQRYAASAEFGVSYETAPKPAGYAIPPDWSGPFFHANHDHVSCDGTVGKPLKKMPLVEKVVIGGAAAGGVAAAVATGVAESKSVESPDQP